MKTSLEHLPEKKQRAYVKARYSKHFEITEEALAWLLERTGHLLSLVETICQERLTELARAADAT
ncbi:hypothetical protein SAMN03159448_06192 [Sinorhizobium sp. NFACC03]|nr:hypothetical protein SAMN03159448_06192 [Sinorhizobium sp. NFACC03]